MTSRLAPLVKQNLNNPKVYRLLNTSRVPLIHKFSTNLPNLKNKQKEQLKLKNEQNSKESENYWPHPLAVFASLTILYGLYWALDVQYRAGKKYSETKSELDKKQNLISSKNPKIIFTLGSPNSKKEEIFDKLISKGYYLIQTSELFTSELNNPQSEYYEEISRSINDNKSISIKTTLSLIRDNMIELLENNRDKFLIDGFPQQMDQLRKFEGSIQDPLLALYFDLPTSELVNELLNKPGNKDSVEVIQKKLHEYQFLTYPIVQYFMRKEKALVINCQEDLNLNLNKILKKVDQLS